MRVDAFDFELPESLIALRPARPRDAARLMVVDPGSAACRHAIVRDLPDLLEPGDALVANDTRVVPARLDAVRRRGDSVARIDITLHKRLDAGRWAAFARPAKRLATGDRLAVGGPGGEPIEASVEARDGADVVLAFALTGAALDEALDRLGRPPLPPYIESRRAADAGDEADYQTLFAARRGAVAAPTAGLHFTPDLLNRLASRGIAVHRVTLHVGAGTFLPVKAETTDAHVMHAEWGEISPGVAAELNAVRAAGRRVVAVGTTSLRILESAATPDGRLHPFAGETSIFITPGYRFRFIDGLMTNFHLPRSTLFMLVSAFCGLERMQSAYREAIAQGYRFYSYGDASLLWPSEAARPLHRPEP